MESEWQTQTFEEVSDPPTRRPGGIPAAPYTPVPGRGAGLSAPAGEFNHEVMRDYVILRWFPNETKFSEQSRVQTGYLRHQSMLLLKGYGIKSNPH